jgi:hypothetical protein
LGALVGVMHKPRPRGDGGPRASRARPRRPRLGRPSRRARTSPPSPADRSDCASAVLALSVLNVERVALEGPPLVRSAAQRTRRRYFRPEGFDIVSSASADLPYDPHRIEPVAVYTWRSRRVRDDAEGASSASVSGLGSANGSRGVRRGAAATPLTSTSAGPCVSKFSGVF